MKRYNLMRSKTFNFPVSDKMLQRGCCIKQKNSISTACPAWKERVSYYSHTYLQFYFIRAKTTASSSERTSRINFVAPFVLLLLLFFISLFDGERETVGKLLFVSPYTCDKDATKVLTIFGGLLNGKRTLRDC